MLGTTVRAAGLRPAVLRGHKLPSGISLSSQEGSTRANSGVTRAGRRARRAWRHFLNRMLAATNLPYAVLERSSSAAARNAGESVISPALQLDLVGVLVALCTATLRYTSRQNCMPPSCAPLTVAAICTAPSTGSGTGGLTRVASTASGSVGEARMMPMPLIVTARQGSGTSGP